MNQTLIPSSLNLDHPNVKYVLEIAEEIIAENQVLSLEKLYKRAKLILKIPGKGLRKIINYLVNKKILVDQSRFTRVSVLSNHLREILYLIICNNPGFHLSAVRKLLERNTSNLGIGQFLWHIDMLIKFNYIKTIKIGNFLVLLPIEMETEQGKIYYFLQDDLNYNILNLVLIRSEIKRSEIYKILGETREVVYYHIKILVDYELLVVKNTKMIRIHPEKNTNLKSILSEENIILKKY